MPVKHSVSTGRGLGVMRWRFPKNGKPELQMLRRGVPLASRRRERCESTVPLELERQANLGAVALDRAILADVGIELNHLGDP